MTTISQIMGRLLKKQYEKIRATIAKLSIYLDKLLSNQLSDFYEYVYKKFYCFCKDAEVSLDDLKVDFVYFE